MSLCEGCVNVMYRLLLSCLAFALAIILPRAAPALELTDLYSAEVPVADQRAAARTDAARAALAEVLVKVTGDAAAPTQPTLQPLLKQAEQLLQSYQYRATPGASSSQSLAASFDREAINQRIYQAGLPVWGGNRSQLVVWLAVDDGNGRALLGGDRRPALQAAVNDEARRRGLPVILPQPEGQDAPALVNDVWAQTLEPVLRASARYHADGVLLARISQTGPDRWRSRWLLRQAGNSSSWEGREGSLIEVATAGIGAAAAELAQRYALVLKPGVSAVATLSVDRIGKVEDYARVSRYLAALDAVSAVVVDQVQGDTVIYRLQLRSDLPGLTRLLAMGGILTPAGAETAPAAGELAYHLTP